MILTPQELIELTHRRYPAWQAKALDSMKIRYKRRVDGTLVVLRADLLEPHDQPKREPQLRAG